MADFGLWTLDERKRHCKLKIGNYKMQIDFPYFQERPGEVSTYEIKLARCRRNINVAATA